MTASVSLIFDGGYHILVDSPSAADMKAKETMLRSLSSRSITPGEVQLVITTHGHPDHFGQGNFFPNARHFFGSYEYADDNFIRTELHVNESMRITTNVELWNTPGHTAQDITVIVSNVPCCGTVAVVGKRNRDKVICQADFIIPGHGKLFRNLSFKPYTFPTFTFTPADRNTFAYPTATQSPNQNLNDDGLMYVTAMPSSDKRPMENPAPLAINTVFVKQDDPKLLDRNYSMDNENVFAPVIEKAASQMAKLLNVNNDVVPKQKPYPYTHFWKHTAERLANDVNMNNLFNDATMHKLKPLVNYLRTARGPAL
ncbi:metallo-beta-lactamase domain protein [Ancylostoma ceylanicum]|uniref:Metallo-beta-lactamase domain protein n=2 Tax=Ancylostoma ceylanicum TaxID=53326 RepID=A0A0D6LFE9_9BILA|nr:metallo-beta-lactamase domain protein [Ancylostoma ceylanicum]